MDEEEKTFLKLFHEKQPNIFYLSLAAALSILMIYFSARWYFYGSFSFQENMKIIFYLILQFSLIFYEFNQAFKLYDLLQLSIFIIPIFIFHFSLCSYIKLESIIASYERFSKDSNKKIVRMIVGMILLSGFIECNLFILNNKFVIESQLEATFFIIDKSKVLPVKKPIILSLFHAQTMNLFSLSNYIAFIVCIQLRLSSLFMLNLNWFLNSLHELFQAFLSFHFSENIISAIPDAIFHASFALFYFLKQKAFATLVKAIKEILLIFWNDNETKTKEEEEENQKELDVDKMFNEIVDERNENHLNNDDDIVIDSNKALNSNNEIDNNKALIDEDFQMNDTDKEDDN